MKLTTLFTKRRQERDLLKAQLRTQNQRNAALAKENQQLKDKFDRMFYTTTERLDPERAIGCRLVVDRLAIKLCRVPEELVMDVARRLWEGVKSYTR